MDLTKTFSEDQYGRALERWEGLSFDAMAPRFTSLFGDVFFEAADGSWWVLNLLDGELTQHWANGGAMAADLAREDGQDRFLLGVLAMAAHRNGKHLAADEVYVFIPHPMISGDFSVERIHALTFVAAMDIAAQLHGFRD